MRTYIIRRLLLMIPTMVLVTIVVFLMIRFIPGSVVELMLFQMGGGWRGYVGGTDNPGGYQGVSGAGQAYSRPVCGLDRGYCHQG